MPRGLIDAYGGPSSSRSRRSQTNDEIPPRSSPQPQLLGFCAQYLFGPFPASLRQVCTLRGARAVRKDSQRLVDHPRGVNKQEKPSKSLNALGNIDDDPWISTVNSPLYHPMPTDGVFDGGQSLRSQGFACRKNEEIGLCLLLSPWPRSLRAPFICLLAGCIRVHLHQSTYARPRRCSPCGIADRQSRRIF